jgi:hypothetical protein
MDFFILYFQYTFSTKEPVYFPFMPVFMAGTTRTLPPGSRTVKSGILRGHQRSARTNGFRSTKLQLYCQTSYFFTRYYPGFLFLKFNFDSCPVRHIPDLIVNFPGQSEMFVNVKRKHVDFVIQAAENGQQVV